MLDQRRAYKQLSMKQPGDRKKSISQEQIDKLESIGFQWKLRNRGGRGKGRGSDDRSGDHEASHLRAYHY